MDYGQPKLDQSEEAGRQARDTEASKARRPARGVEVNRGMEAYKEQRGEKEEDPPGAGDSKRAEVEKKQDRWGLTPFEIQGKQQEGVGRTTDTDGRGPGSRLPGLNPAHRGRLRREMGRFPDLCCESNFGDITVYFSSGRWKGFSVRINESHLFGNKVVAL